MHILFSRDALAVNIEGAIDLSYFRINISRDIFSVGLNLLKANPITPYTQRQKLEKVEECFRMGEGRKLIISGLPGVGKTQIARKYADTHKNEYSVVIEINAENEDTLKQEFKKLYNNDLIRDQAGAIRFNGDELIKEVMELFNSKQRALFIFNNLDINNINDLKERLCLDHLDRKHDVIIINLVEIHDDSFDYMHVDNFSEGEALDYIRARIPNIENAAATRIAKIFDFYPLGIVVATSYLQNNRADINNFGNNLDNINIVTQVIMSSINKVIEQEPQVREAINAYSYLGTGCIPVEMFNNFPNVLNILNRYSIVAVNTKNGEDTKVTIHSFIQKIIRENYNNIEYLHRARDLFYRYSQIDDPTILRDQQQLKSKLWALDHLRTLLNYYTNLPENNGQLGIVDEIQVNNNQQQLRGGFGIYDYFRGWIERYYNNEHAELDDNPQRVRDPIPIMLSIARLHASCGNLYFVQGMLKEARDHYSCSAMAINQLIDTQDQNIIFLLKNLASNVYLAMRNIDIMVPYDIPENLMARANDLWKAKVLYLTSCYYCKHGRYGEALDGLSIALHKTSQYELSSKFLNSQTKECEKKLFLANIRNLDREKKALIANILDAAGAVHKARSALDKFNHLTHANGYDVGNSINFVVDTVCINMEILSYRILTYFGISMERNRGYIKALMLYKLADKININIYEQNHVRILHGKQRILEIKIILGHDVFNELLKIEKLYNPERNYVDLAIIKHNKANSLERDREYNEAKKLHEESLKIKVKYGDNYLLANAYSALAHVNHKIGLYHEAIANEERTIQSLKEFSKDHPAHTRVKYNLGIYEVSNLLVIPFAIKELLESSSSIKYIAREYLAVDISFSYQKALDKYIFANQTIANIKLSTIFSNPILGVAHWTVCFLGISLIGNQYTQNVFIGKREIALLATIPYVLKLYGNDLYTWKINQFIGNPSPNNFYKCMFVSTCFEFFPGLLSLMLESFAMPFNSNFVAINTGSKLLISALDCYELSKPKSTIEYNESSFGIFQNIYTITPLILDVLVATTAYKNIYWPNFEDNQNNLLISRMIALHQVVTITNIIVVTDYTSKSLISAFKDNIINFIDGCASYFQEEKEFLPIIGNVEGNTDL